MADPRGQEVGRSTLPVTSLMKREDQCKINRAFSCDVTKIGNEVGGHIGVPLCSTWLLNQLRIAYLKTLELKMNRSRSGIMEKNLYSHAIERYVEKVFNNWC